MKMLSCILRTRILTVVRETERETSAPANKPRDYKKEVAYPRENYRRFKRKYVTEGVKETIFTYLP